ncbi:hypothetical protein GEMRC1_006985 [Eukaryota sp. GEM-RC1]
MSLPELPQELSQSLEHNDPECADSGHLFTTPSFSLTPAQQKVVDHHTGPCLCVAAAGSGKSSTLVEKIVHLIQNQSVDPSSICLLTFTRNAAEHIVKRTIKSVGIGAETICKGTFHSVAARFLMKYSTLLDMNWNEWKLVDRNTRFFNSMLTKYLNTVHSKPSLPPGSVLNELYSFSLYEDVSVIVNGRTDFEKYADMIGNILSFFEFVDSQKFDKKSMILMIF